MITRFAKWFQTLLPSPFTIAILLSVLAFLGCLFWAPSQGEHLASKSITLLQYWEEGLWNGPLLIFTLQMMLILVLGHALALSKPFDILISRFLPFCTNTAKTAALISLVTMLLAFFNWGLALVFGAVFARKVAEYATKNTIAINYPLIGAAAYSGMMVWHGGFSGSSLIKVAESGHLQSLTNKSSSLIPNVLGFSETVFSGMNLSVSLVLLILIPTALFLLGSNIKSEVIELDQTQAKTFPKPKGAEKIDHSTWVGTSIGLIILFVVAYRMFTDTGFLNYFTPNRINFLLLGLALTFHRKIQSFLSAIDQAIGGAAGILIQFPLYFGIMGMLVHSGLIEQLTAGVASFAGENSFPYFTFLSAAIINVFVPSGGGQWAIQGPLIVEAVVQHGVSLPKSILAMAYGDQLTNMLQPFWALPLLGITRLKACDILPFSIYIMLFGFVTFSLALFFF